MSRSANDLLNELLCDALGIKQDRNKDWHLTARVDSRIRDRLRELTGQEEDE
jgi:hypothetical protein